MAAGKKCFKCEFENLSYDGNDMSACPSCGAIYSKVEAHKAQVQKQASQAKPTKTPVARKVSKALKAAIESPEREKVKNRKLLDSLFRVYKGKQSDAVYDFQKDQEKLNKEGFEPVTKFWEKGSWGCSAFLVALALVPVFGIGIFMFIYLIIVKPKGELTVTYARKKRA